MAKHARVTGVVLAAGEGRRMGMPKALVQGEDGRSWLERTLWVMVEGGIRDDLLVAEGAAEEAVDAEVAAFWHAYRQARERREITKLGGLGMIPVPDWREGMGASLRTVLKHFLDHSSGFHAALVMLVDLPDVGPDVIRRVLDHVDAVEDRSSVLARATYDGRPGHPVLIGRDHWAAMSATLSGDEGGRRYLADHGAVAIECGDLATGRDQDTPPGSPGPE